MATFVKEHKEVKFLVPLNKEIDLTHVYQPGFFTILGIDATIHYPIEPVMTKIEAKADEEVENASKVVEEGLDTASVLVKTVENDMGAEFTPSQEVPVPIQFNEQASLPDILLGPEKTPNGYTDLPLDVSKKEPEAVSNSSSIIQKIGNYVRNFFGNSAVYPVDEDADNTEALSNIVIRIPLNRFANTTPSSKRALLEIENDVQSLQDWKLNRQSSPFSIYGILDTNIDYLSLEDIIHDLTIQLEYLKGHGIGMKNINIEQVYFVHGRILIFDTENMVLLSKVSSTPSSYKLISEIVYTLLGKGYEAIEQLRGTRIWCQMHMDR